MQTAVAFIVLICNCFSQETFSTDSNTYKKRIYKATVLNNKKLVAQNYLLNITDSTVVLSASPLPFNSLTMTNASIKQFGYPEIESVVLKRKGSVGRGALSGLLIGGGIGAIAGLALGDDTEGWFRLSAGDKAAALGLFGGLTGALTGALVGALTHHKFIINYKRENLREMDRTLLEKLYSRTAQ